MVEAVNKFNSKNLVKMGHELSTKFPVPKNRAKRRSNTKDTRDSSKRFQVYILLLAQKSYPKYTHEANAVLRFIKQMNKVREDTWVGHNIFDTASLDHSEIQLLKVFIKSEKTTSKKVVEFLKFIDKKLTESMEGVMRSIARDDIHTTYQGIGTYKKISDKLIEVLDEN